MSRSVRSPDYRQARDQSFTTRSDRYALLTQPDEPERQGDGAPNTPRLRLRLVEPQN